MTGLRFAASHKRNIAPLFTIWLLLATGLGAAALLYTALERLLLHPLAVSHPETLVRAAENQPPLYSWKWFPYTTYQAMLGMRTLEGVAAEGILDTVLTQNGSSIPVVAEMVSGNYFSILGVKAEQGRTLTPSDDRPGDGENAIVLSHRFYKQQFGNSAFKAGQSLNLQGVPFSVVGVMPEHFFGTSLDTSPDLWLPTSAQPLFSNKPLTDPDRDMSFSIVARLHSGVTLSQAGAEFGNLFHALQKQSGDDYLKSTGVLTPIEEGSFQLRKDFGQALKLMLWGIALLLLLICASIAGVLLVRQLRRERDQAVRLALGATRARLILESLREAIALGLAGAVGGILVSWLFAPLLMRLLPATLTPLPISLTPDVRVDSIIVVLALLLSIGFGVLPAWYGCKANPQDALRGGSATKKSGMLSRVILITQVAGALVLLVGTGLLLHTLYALRHTNPGFDVDHLAVFAVNPSVHERSAQIPSSLALELQQRIQSLPGIRGASLASAPLMQRFGLKTSVALPGQKIPSVAFLNTSMDSVSNTFFDTMGIRILAGRSFLPTDATQTGQVPAVINGAFARLLFPNQNPIGRTFGSGAPGTIAKGTNVIVGIADDSKYRSMREGLLPIFYLPIEKQSAFGSQFYLYVRTAGEPESIVSEARRTLANLAPQLPFSHVTTMEQQVNESLWQERLLSALAVVFSTIALATAGIGLFGLLAYDANQRKREFGIRCALGSQKVAIAGLLIRQMLSILLPGVAIGLVLCFFLGRAISSTLYGVTTFDIPSFTSALLMVLLVTTLASFTPLRSALRIEPARVLREE